MMDLQLLPKKLLLKGGTIYDPLKDTMEKKDLLIVNGKIASMKKGENYDDAKAIDCAGKIITHGFCDLHVHFREPGREDKETLATGSLAALAGGFTRVCVMPNTNPPLDTPESIRFILEKAKDVPVHIHPIGAITRQQGGTDITEMGLMRDEGAVAFSDDGLPVQDGSVMRRALEYGSMFDLPIINHAEDICIREDGVMNEGFMSTKLGLSGNPNLAESSMVYRDLALGEMTGGRLHVPHVSTTESAEHIKEMKKTNKKVTAEVAPHHLYFNDEVIASFNTNLKVAPPIRSEEDRTALVQAVIEGVFDCIATDHAPHTIEEKEASFDLASFGMIGLESCFGVVNKVLVHQNKLPLSRLIQMLTVNPRRIMGFKFDLFQEGVSAELTVIDPKSEWVFSKNDIYSRSKNSPYLEEKLQGRPVLTIAKNKIAFIV
ncbi:MAG: dihydroorotase [Candidatus Marinimicrobia bacterium]|jgi:dihydroorotase|nr:dihydroorotase [Candidatus Neomarinimicrobiota bacterium]MBT3495795.1 dihydroorotase [Candidatus Neomarinimicrobiota bacterium]MBT3691644.1 dihydroorotase [Candidatus Neomarinimicrobiota bacterium]MBT3732737.1 dihydroorotase [Candidatus Neomarinimicrobiota bacterium]MBT4592944.1 dihydroorotase [Candidatus Neomarinimicrobiota bacterium]